MFSNSRSLLSHIHCKYAIIIPGMAFKTTASGNPELAVVLAESSAGAVSFIRFQISKLTTLTTDSHERAVSSVLTLSFSRVFLGISKVILAKFTFVNSQADLERPKKTLIMPK